MTLVLAHDMAHATMLELLNTKYCSKIFRVMS